MKGGIEMSVIPLSAIFLMFQFDIRVISGGQIMFLSLIPRFLGYIILLKGLRKLEPLEYIRRRYTVFVALTVFEVIRFLAGLLSPIFALRYQPAAATVSVIIMLWTIWTIIKALRELEMLADVDIDAGKLRTRWYVLLASGAASFLVILLPLVSRLASLASIVAAIVLIVELFRVRRNFKERAEPSVIRT